VLRRTRALETTAAPVIQAGSLGMDLHRRILWRSGTQVHLSPKEFDLLAFMMQNQGAPLTHVRLLRSVWGPEYGNELEYLRSYVRMLRKKIENDPAKPDYILTEPWVGYRFRNPSDQEAPVVPQLEEA
jgi:two-component system KDP operon response regulator KdpE